MIIWLQGDESVIHVEIHQLPRYMEWTLANKMLQNIFREITYLKWSNAPSTLRYLNIYHCKQVTKEMLAHLEDYKIIR